MKIEKGLILSGRIESIKEINDEIEVMLKDSNDEMYCLKTKDSFYAKKDVEVSFLVNDEKNKILSLITYKKVLLGNLPLIYLASLFKSTFSLIRWIFFVFIIILLFNTITEGSDGFISSLFIPMMIPIIWGFNSINNI